MKETTAQFTITTITAEGGKMLKRVSDGEVLGESLTLGKSDSADNYVETDEVANPSESEEEV